MRSRQGELARPPDAWCGAFCLFAKAAFGGLRPRSPLWKSRRPTGRCCNYRLRNAPAVHSRVEECYFRAHDQPSLRAVTTRCETYLPKLTLRAWGRDSLSHPPHRRVIAPELVTPLAYWLCVQELVTPGQRRPVCTDAELATPLVFETMCARLTAAKSHT